ncbi:INHBB [Cordylochernes scorpioides]|uniref:INHBB n=1 Tax=Cordylochernes scorpioides TaxID=51811 RepID=A0ABY6LE35_9ARAC|nr:INHBB [Cordylochernes scorpioides]
MRFDFLKEARARLNNHVLLDFYPPRENVISATLYVELRYATGLPRRVRHMLRDHSVTLYVFRAISDGTGSTPDLDLVASQRVPTAHGGWRRLNLTPPSGPLKTDHRLTLLVDCVGCDTLVELVLFPPNGSRPFLSLGTEVSRSRRSRRHALTCEPSTTQCCKQPLWVGFKELGWDDWIIAPKGYWANYCMGDCAARRTPDTFVNFHTHVLEEYRNRNPYASITPCCAPTKLSSMSLIYFDPDLNIIKTDLPKMVVDECGCT